MSAYSVGERSRGGWGLAQAKWESFRLTAPVRHRFVVTEEAEMEAEVPEAHQLWEAPSTGLQILRSDTVVPLLRSGLLQSQVASPLL